MSSDDGDEEDLRQLLVRKLEDNGVLASLRAQLRASVFLALEEHDSTDKKANVSLDDFKSSAEGKLATAVVFDFLRHLELKASLCVLQKEMGMDDTGVADTGMLSQLKTDPIESSSKSPILLNLVSASKQRQSVNALAKLTPLTREKPLDATVTNSMLMYSESKSDHHSSSESEDIFEKPQPSQLNKSWLSSNKPEKKINKPEPLAALKMPGKTDLDKVNSSGSSILGELPSLTRKGLPPLGLNSGSKADTKGASSDKDFLKLLNDSLENLDSENSESASTPKPEAEIQLQTVAVSKLEKQKTIDEPSDYKALVFKRPSPRVSDKDGGSSVSEEIVEDLEVDDVLDSGRSGDVISF